MAIIKFFTYEKKIPWNLVPMILQTKLLCCGHYTKLLRTYIFGNIFFIIHFLVSVAYCGYVHLFCSYLSKNEAVKLSFTSFIIYFSCWPSIMQYQSDFLKK